MTLGQRQRIFTRNVARLIEFAYDIGFELSFGNTTAPTGLATSLHPQRLAIDLNLFRNGKYLRSTRSHEWLGAYWSNLHPRNRWGGEFGDGKHYETR